MGFSRQELLEWVAISFSRRSSQPRDQTQVSHIAGRFFTSWATSEAPLTVQITTNCGKFWKRWEYQTILSVSWETCMQVKKQQLEPCMEQLIGSRSRNEYDRAIYCHFVCLFNLYAEHTMRNAGWMSYKLEWRWVGEITTSLWYHSNGKKAKRN